LKIFKGTKKYTIKSDVNPSAALSFFNNYEHTLTSTKPNYDYVIHLDNNLISMINTISYYVDENKKEKVGSTEAKWNYYIFIGEDVWITC